MFLQQEIMETTTEPLTWAWGVRDGARQARLRPPAAYRSEFAGMVGSMETMASSVVSREMVVFLQDTRVRAAPLNGPRAREAPQRLLQPRAPSTDRVERPCGPKSFKMGIGESLIY